MVFPPGRFPLHSFRPLRHHRDAHQVRVRSATHTCDLNGHGGICSGLRSRKNQSPRSPYKCRAGNPSTWRCWGARMGPFLTILEEAVPIDVSLGFMYF